MENQQYRQFMMQLCRVAKLPNEAQFLEESNIIVDEIDFTLTESLRGDDVGVAVHCDMGRAPTVNRMAILERLLEMNLALFSAEPTVFSMNSETGHVVLNSRLSLASTTPAQALTVLAQHATCARQWRLSYFLVDDNGPRKTLNARDPRFQMPA